MVKSGDSRCCSLPKRESVTTAPNFSLGAVNPVFKHPTLRQTVPYPQYDISADGNHFIIPVPMEKASESKQFIHVVMNWYEEFRDRDQD